MTAGGAAERTTLARAAAVCLFFVACLLLALLGVRRGLRLVPGLRLEEPGPPAIKAAHLQEHAGEIDVVFVGSSRVYRQLNPAVFELRSSERGIPLRAYNLGLPGMQFPESLYTAEWVVEQAGGHPRWVVLELQDPDPEFVEATRFTQRSINWHTPWLCAAVCRTVLASDRAPRRKLDELSAHLLELGYNVSNANTGVPALAALLGLAGVPEDSTPGGFLPLDLDRNPSSMRRRDELLHELAADPKYLEKQVEERLGAPAKEALPAAVVDAVRAFVGRMRARGVEPVFILLPPAKERSDAWHEAQRRGILTELFAYDDPEAYPRFYLDQAIRFDVNHLNKKGANELTNLFVADFCDYLSREQER